MGVETLAGREAFRLFRRSPEKYVRGVWTAPPKLPPMIDPV